METWEAGAASLPRGKGLDGQSNTQHQGDGPGERAGREGNHTARDATESKLWLDSQGQQV